MCEEGATHSIPRELQAKFVEAKKWYDERCALEDTIRRSSGLGSAQRNQDDWDESDRIGALLLDDVVELCNEAWGFAIELEKPK